MSSFFEHTDFDHHETVMFAEDEATGLRGIIAVHSTVAGPACGGVRYWAYDTEEAALSDVLRLSRGMTYKNIMADLPLGGGKSVIMADPNRPKDAALMKAFGRAVDRLGGSYIAAEDVGITVDDVMAMRSVTPHVAGTRRSGQGAGDPSPYTALGVFLGLQSAARFGLGIGSLAGVRVGVLGLGAVGFKLAEHLHEVGAHLIVADINAERVAQAVDQWKAEAVDPDSLASMPMDVFAPCALGGVLTAETIAALQAKVVAGAANNQLADERCGELLHRRGILYAPDYVINAAGVIQVATEITPAVTAEDAKAKIEAIPDRLAAIFQRARNEYRPTDAVADMIAREKLAALPARMASAA